MRAITVKNDRMLEQLAREWREERRRERERERGNQLFNITKYEKKVYF